MTKKTSIIALIDMDCFYAQVEQRLRPNLWEKPVVVVQYTSTFKGGGILAVSYEARPYGIKRGMFADEAKLLCPELNVCYVPNGEFSDKADLAKYREASNEVFKILNEFDPRIIVERASIDEAYLDLTVLVDFILSDEDLDQKYSQSLYLFPTTYVVDGSDLNCENREKSTYNREESIELYIRKACEFRGNLLRLLIGAELLERIRQQIKNETKFNCSAGIANSKTIAKLICSRHKPGKQSVICEGDVPKVYESTAIDLVRNFGGKLGRAVKREFRIETMGELSRLSLAVLSDAFPVQAKWIYDISHGVDVEPVRARQKQTSIAVSKNFPGASSLKTVDDVKSWLTGLARELVKRLVDDQVKHKRSAKTLHMVCTTDTQFGKSVRLLTYDVKNIINLLWSAIRSCNKSTSTERWEPPVVHMGMSASRFCVGVDESCLRITEFFNKAEKLLSETPQTKEQIDCASVGDSLDTFNSGCDVDSRSRTTDDFTSGNQPSVSGIGAGRNSADNDQYFSTDFLPTSFDEITEDSLQHLPPDIRKELQFYYLQKNRNRTIKRESSSKNIASKRCAGKSKKRAASSSNRKIMDFFGKKVL